MHGPLRENPKTEPAPSVPAPPPGKRTAQGGFPPLKVVHLATTDFGEAGKAAYRLHQGLRALGVDSTLLVVTRKNGDPSVRVLPSGRQGEVADCPLEFPANNAYAQRVVEHWSALVTRYPQRASGMDTFSDDFSEISLECCREIREADIVNLHWVSGIFNCLNAVLALRGKKIVWTMHDMNPVTGGCHYAGDCAGYLKNCGSCPMLGSPDDADISRTIWQFKQYAYGKLDLHPVAPSRWLAEVASQSALFSRLQTRIIPNGFPDRLEVQAQSYRALYHELLAPRQEKQAAPEKTGVAERAGSTPKPGIAVTPCVPRLSLVIPSYNYGQYLEACLDSILSQGYQNLELIVLDGGSTDDSPAIIERYRKYLSYSRSHPDAGQYSAIEEGLRRSSGAIMGWLNADDMFHPGAFQAVSEIFSEYPEVEWLTGRPNSFDEKGKQKVVLSFLPMTSRAKYLADQELIQQEGSFWRRELWERSGAYIAKGLPLAADLELWARFLRSAQLFTVDRLIAGFRDHPLQKSKDKAGYTAEANQVLGRERSIFAAEANRFSPPAPLPILWKT